MEAQAQISRPSLPLVATPPGAWYYVRGLWLFVSEGATLDDIKAMQNQLSRIADAQGSKQ